MSRFLNKIYKLIKKPKPEVIFFIGLPGCGKSTLIRKMLKDFRYSEHIVASSDDYIEKIAADKKLTYSEVFKSTIPHAQKHFEKIIDEAVLNNNSILIDRMNVTKEERQSVLKKIPSHYSKKAIVFHVPAQELKLRLQRRANLTGKVIPEYVFEQIIKSYEHPDLKEFNEIKKADETFSRFFV